MRTFTLSLVMLAISLLASTQVVFAEDNSDFHDDGYYKQWYKMVVVETTRDYMDEMRRQPMPPPVPGWLAAMPAEQRLSFVPLNGGDWAVSSREYFPLDHEHFAGKSKTVWKMYNSNGELIPNRNTARGTGWQDVVWPDGYYDTLDRSPYVDYRESAVHEGSVINVTHIGRMVFVFEFDDETGSLGANSKILQAFDGCTGEELWNIDMGTPCELPVYFLSLGEEFNHLTCMN